MKSAEDLRPVRNAARARFQAAPPSRAPRLQIALRVGAARGSLLAALYTFHRVEQFLIRDSRFAMNGPDGSAMMLP